MSINPGVLHCNSYFTDFFLVNFTLMPLPNFSSCHTFLVFLSLLAFGWGYRLFWLYSILGNDKVSELLLSSYTHLSGHQGQIIHQTPEYKVLTTWMYSHVRYYVITGMMHKELSCLHSSNSLSDDDAEVKMTSSPVH